jgi:hypothetical protein
MTTVGTRQMVPLAFVDQQTGVMYVDQSEFPFSYLLPIIGRPIDDLLWGSVHAARVVANRAPGGSIVGNTGIAAAKATGTHGARRATRNTKTFTKNVVAGKEMLEERAQEMKANKEAQEEQTRNEHEEKVAAAEEQRKAALAQNAAHSNGEQAKGQGNEQKNANTTTVAGNHEHTSGPLTLEQQKAREQEQRLEYQQMLAQDDNLKADQDRKRKEDEIRRQKEEEEKEQDQRENEEAARKRQEEMLEPLYWKKLFFEAESTRELNNKTRVASPEKMLEMKQFVAECIKREKSKMPPTICMKCALQYT